MGLFDKNLDSKIMDDMGIELEAQLEDLENLKSLVQSDLALESMMIGIFIETNAIIEFIKKEFGEEKYKEIYLPIKELIKKHKTVQLLYTNHQMKMKNFEKLKDDIEKIKAGDFDGLQCPTTNDIN